MRDEFEAVTGPAGGAGTRPAAPWRAAAVLVPVYVVLAGLWFFYADAVVAALAPALPAARYYGQIKGLVFILVTALLLAQLLRRASARWHRAEAGRQRCDAQQQALIAHLPQRIFFKDPGSRYLDCNAVFAADVQRTPAALRGHTDAEVFPRPVADKLRADDQRVLASGQVLEADEPYLTGGREIRVHSVKAPVRDGTGRLLGVLGILWDITAQHTADRALRASEERYRLLVETSPDAVVVHRAGRILYVNPAGLRLCGATSPDELLGQSIFDRIPAASHAAIRTRLATLAAGGQLPRLEQQLIRLDGAVLDMEVISTAISFEGQPAVQSLIRDITQRQQAEAARRTLEEQLQTLIQSSPDIICFKDGAGLWQVANQGYLDLYHLADADFHGKTDAELAARAPPPYRDALWQGTRADETAWRQKAPLHLEEAVPQAGGPSLYIESDRVPVFNPDGSRKGLIIMARDVTARRQAEEQIQRLAAVVEQSAETVIMTDMQGDILYVNPAFETMSGYPRGEVLGRNPRILKSDRQDEAFYRDMWATLTAGRVWSGHLTNRHKDGSLREVEAVITPIRVGTDRPGYFVATERDVTREMQLEHQFHQAQKMETIGRLAGGVAHEFNNLLQAILGFAELLLASTPAEDERRDDLLQVQRAATRAAQLTRQLLAFSRKQMIDPRVMNLNASITDMEKMLHRILGEGVQLELALAPDLQPLKADPVQIEQILLNLAVNARDAMPHGGRVSIRTANVTFSEAEAALLPEACSGSFLCLSFTDTGHGISREAQEHLFEPFYSTKGLGQGTGLGLAVIYGIVKQNNGWLNVYSKIDHGTAFSIYLPAFPGAQVPPPPAALPLEQPVPRGAGEHVLVVEDEPEVRAHALHLLRSAGYLVTVAESGKLARLAFAVARPPIQAVFSDIVLPDGNGIQLADELHAQHPDLPILLCSGYSDALSRWNRIAERGYPFLQKPYPAAALLNLLHQALAGRRAA